MRTALFLTQLLSFGYLALGLFVARIAKYFLFGIQAFGWKWNHDPSFSDQFNFIWDHCAMPYLWIVLVGCVLDRLVGPLFFREEVAELRRLSRDG